MMLNTTTGAAGGQRERLQLSNCASEEKAYAVKCQAKALGSARSSAHKQNLLHVKALSFCLAFIKQITCQIDPAEMPLRSIYVDPI